MRVWITKYALTQGILEFDATVCSDVSEKMIAVRRSDTNWDFDVYFHGNDWHETREVAVTRAEEMRWAKIESLKKSIAKMETLRFAD